MIAIIFTIGGLVVGICGGVLAAKKKSDIVATSYGEFWAGVILGGVLFAGIGYGLGRLIESI